MREITAEAAVHRLHSLSELQPDDRALVAGVPGRAVTYPAGSVLLQQQQAIVNPHLLLSGWAWRTRTLPNGRQQVFAIVVPGDFIGLCWRPKPRALSSTIAITAVKTANASSLWPVIRGGGKQNPGLWEALTLASRHDEMRLLDQVVRLGRQTALERVISLMLELHARLKTVALATERGFEMPLTQEDLAAALGLSVVHVNRTVQQLRRDGLAAIGSGRVEFLALDQLKSLSSFEATAQPYAEAI